MESVFEVRITPRKMVEVFEDYDNFNIRWYEFRGIKERNDFDFENATETERKALIDTQCIYLVRLRHAEWVQRLPHNKIYKSWDKVIDAIQQRKKETEDYNFSRYEQIGDMRWRASVITENDNHHTIVEVRTVDNKFQAVKGWIDFRNDFSCCDDVNKALMDSKYESLSDVEKIWKIISENIFDQISSDELLQCSPLFDNKADAVDYAVNTLIKKG